MVSRLICIFLASCSLLIGAGLLDRKEKKVIPEDVKADRDLYRDTIEVGGVHYPVYLIDEEVKPKRRAKVAIPKKAKRQGRGGVVLIGTIIAKTGRVKEMSIAMTNAEQDIQNAVTKAVGQWLFPTLRDDEDNAFEYIVMIPITVDATPRFGPADGAR
ncbi:MAG: energy transducer TonB [Verrucomicrobiia bacterium]|tara:strand:- start:5364 stop:5837 length:474 start_codon:yes stop_codon:yes gene_type:complete